MSEDKALCSGALLFYIKDTKKADYLCAMITKCYCDTYLPLYYFENGVNPLSHGLAIDCIKEGMKFCKQ